MTVGYTFLIYQDGGNYDWIATAPGRKLILDSEFRTDSIPGEVVQWDGKGGFPECGNTATVVLPILDADALAKAIPVIKAGKLPVQTIVLMSVTMLQQNEMEKNFNGAPTNQQGWGKLLQAFSSSLKSLLTSAKDHKTSVECVIICAGAKELVVGESVKVRPFIEGQLQGRISYLTDVVGYMTRQGLGARKSAKLQIEPTDSVYARSNYSALDKYNGFVTDPNIKTLINDMKK